MKLRIKMLSSLKTNFAIRLGMNNEQLIIGMHPHGVVPYQAILWAAYCDLYMPELYGFGAAANVVIYIPFLRNIMGWLSAGSADYKVLKAGIAEGVVASVNAAGRIPRHLYILPGGIAEVFTSRPRSNTIVFKNRRGLVRLSIETGAKIVPAYMFGGTDFYHNLSTHSGWLANISRKLRIGVTIFWGKFGMLPIPYAPRVTLCIGEPITPPVWIGKGTNAQIPPELIEELHGQLLDAMVALFEKYKAPAGYADAVLEVI